jgi:hypothetical protein
MEKLASRAFLAFLVLATVSSVNCHFDTSTLNLDVEGFRGCYEEVTDELSVVLNLGPPDNTISNNDGSIATNSFRQLLGCLTFAKNGQPFLGPFPLIGEAINNTTAKMKAMVPPADPIEVVLTRKDQVIGEEVVVSISIDFPGEPPMENIPKELSEYVKDPMCPTQCRQEVAP